MIIPSFNPTYQRNYMIDWIKEYFADNGTPDTKAVIGISGGKDSTVAAALLVRALGPERVIGVLMPDGSQKDIEDSYRVCKALGIKYHEINLATTMDALTDEIPEELFEIKDDNSIYYTNTPARLRMTILYSVAAFVGGRVCHTGNRSEMYVGYTTKYGDLAGDFSLFYNLTATEVIEIGKTLQELPLDLVEKKPSDGMCGKTDEDNLGFTYRELDNYLLNKKVPNAESMSEITKRHKMSRHKEYIWFPYPVRLYRPQQLIPNHHEEDFSDWVI